MSTDVVSSKISELFSTLDLNGDGLISEDEFIKKCQEGQIMVKITQILIVDWQFHDIQKARYVLCIFMLS